jgi:hypothetical protein
VHARGMQRETHVSNASNLKQRKRIE